ncbi:MAG: hypothetical protein MMC33_005837 [Icmadophila ericetorum]|nr:hypothetical protein [Icmadophila ericetorum]
MVSNIWNSAQSKIWDLPENLRGYFGLVEGLPGVGKSFAIAALALYLNDMGCCVIISAPTHGAADGNTQKILDRQNLSDGQEDPPIGYTYDADGREEQKPERVLVDVFPVLDTLLKQQANIPQQEWSKDDKSHLKASYKRVSNDCVQNAGIIITTSNGIGSPVARQNAGEKHKFIWIIIDKQSMDKDSNTFQFLRLVSLKDVCCVILVGDPEQLEPPVLSRYSENNEFAASIRVPYFARALKAGFPSHRFHPDLAKFPNLYTYNGQMRSAISTRALTTRKEMDLSMRKWLGLKPGSENIAYIGVDMVDGKCFENLQTKSKYNVEHVNVGIQFIQTLHLKGGFKEGKRRMRIE